MNKLLLIATIVLFAISLSGCAASQSTENIVDQPTVSSDKQLINIQVGDQVLLVEQVDQIKDIELGLGYRDEIGSDGMLFVLPHRQQATFWMLGMKFPLDMVWIDQGKIIGITADVPIIDPELDLENDNPPVYSSPGKVTHVLELNASRAMELGLSQGDTVLFSAN